MNSHVFGYIVRVLPHSFPKGTQNATSRAASRDVPLSTLCERRVIAAFAATSFAQISAHNKRHG